MSESDIQRLKIGANKPKILIYGYKGAAAAV